MFQRRPPASVLPSAQENRAPPQGLPRCPVLPGFDLKERTEMLTRLILFFCFVFAALLVPIATPAQQTVTCESNDGGRKHCGPPNPGQVGLQRQISGTECIQDRTWGVDDRGLWVDHGCRADFLIGGSNGYSGDNGAYGGGQGDTIKCE